MRIRETVRQNDGRTVGVAFFIDRDADAVRAVDALLRYLL
jgi:hypothetical protein